MLKSGIPANEVRAEQSTGAARCQVVVAAVGALGGAKRKNDGHAFVH